jgi:hypothetical protein
VVEIETTSEEEIIVEEIAEAIVVVSDAVETETSMIQEEDVMETTGTSNGRRTSDCQNQKREFPSTFLTLPALRG